MRKLIALIAFLMIASLPATAQTQQPIRVNCGGASYTDSKGQVWQADTGFSGGTAEILTTLVSGTTDLLLYEDFRWNPASYSFVVPNGQYQVNLYFSETVPNAGSVGARVF